MNRDLDFTALTGPELLTLHERLVRARIWNIHAAAGRPRGDANEMAGELIDLALHTRDALLARIGGQR